MKVDLLTKRACPNCTQAELVLRDLQAELDLDLSIIDAEADSFLFSRHRYDLPVIRLDGRIVSRRTGDPQEIARRLRHAHRMKEARRIDRHVAAGGQVRRVVQVSMADVAQGAQGARPISTAAPAAAPTTSSASTPAASGERQVVRVDISELLGAAGPEVVAAPGRAPRVAEEPEPVGEPLPPLELPSQDAEAFWAPGLPGASARRKLAEIPGVEGVDSAPFFGAVAVRGTKEAQREAARALGADHPPTPFVRALGLAAGAVALLAASAWTRASGQPQIAWVLAAVASLLPLAVREGRWLLRDLPLVGVVPLAASALSLGLALGDGDAPVEWAAAPATIHLLGLGALLWARQRVRAALAVGEAPDGPEEAQRLEVEEGDVLPADGVLAAPTILDERPLGGDEGTERSKGEMVYAGSIAQQPVELVVAATRSRRSLAASQALRGLAATGGGKAEFFGSIVAPLLALATAAGGWVLLGAGPAAAALAGIPAVAIALGVPLTEAAALTMALGKGVGAKSVQAIFRAGAIRSVVLGKRSMLERGVPAFLGLRARQHLDPNHLLALAAAAEAGLDAPIARSIVTHVEELGLPFPKAGAREVHPGAGVEATIDGEKVVLGSARFLEEKGIDLGPLAPTGLDMGRKGSTPIYLAVDGAAAAVLELGAFPAEAARQAIGSLELAGVGIRVATGDSGQAARWLAEAMGLDPSAARGDLGGEAKRGLLDRVDRPLLVAAGTDTLEVVAEAADLTVESSQDPGAGFFRCAAFLIRPDPRGVIDLIRTGRTARRARALALAFAVGGGIASVALVATGLAGPATAAALGLLASAASLAAAASPWVSLR